MNNDHHHLETSGLQQSEKAKPWTAVFLGLGSNVGDRLGHLRWAIDQLAQLEHTTIQAISPIMETPPMGPIEQGPYLNGVVELRTALGPWELLNKLHQLESARGRDRQREIRWGPRTLDLDIVLFGDLEMNQPGLRIPHTGLCDRLFVLEPLAHIAPERVIPGTGCCVRDALHALKRRIQCALDSSPPTATSQ